MRNGRRCTAQFPNVLGAHRALALLISACLYSISKQCLRARSPKILSKKLYRIERGFLYTDSHCTVSRDAQVTGLSLSRLTILELCRERGNVMANAPHEQEVVVQV